MWSFFRREGGKKRSAPKIEVLLSLARVMSTIHNLLHAHLFFAHKRVLPPPPFESLDLRLPTYAFYLGHFWLSNLNFKL